MGWEFVGFSRRGGQCRCCVWNRCGTYLVCEICMIGEYSANEAFVSKA